MNKEDNPSLGSRHHPDESSDSKETTVIRISHKNYEKLRVKAFIAHKPIRQLADEILSTNLRND